MSGHSGADVAARPRRGAGGHVSTVPSRGSRPAARHRADAAAPRPERAGHRPDIEGLRGLSVLLVVAFLAGVAVLPGGFVGVDVFFVISGFLITGLLVDELRRSGTISL